MINVPIDQAVSNLRGLLRRDELRVASQLFAELIAAMLKARTDPHPFCPTVLVFECSEALTNLDNGRERGKKRAETLQDYWLREDPEDPLVKGKARRFVDEEIHQLVELAFGEEFAAEFRNLWPKE